MNTTKLFVSKRTVLPEGVKPAVVIVSDGKIENIITLDNDGEIDLEIQKYPEAECEDFGELVLMPGIVDSHVHINEPGRTQWEGFWTATRAAAAGGVTTVIDMPLNSIPPTTTVHNLKLKVAAARKKTFVDVGFWGGVVPGNQRELKPLVNAGVIGFKCFLIPCGTPDFEYVKDEDVEKALAELQHLKSVLAFHAECEEEKVAASKQDDPASYGTYLKTCPETMEVKAIAKVKDWCEAYNCRCHIVHLSSATALGLIKEAKDRRLPLTAETCFHYLCLAAEQIPRSATQFKCCPPIRNQTNRERLWAALKEETLDIVVSDHSPCTEDLKAGGNYLTAWGGISSLQFGLPLLWTEARKRDFGLRDVARVLCSGPAKLSGFDDRKGSLRIGMDADFVVWDPEQTIEVRVRPRIPLVVGLPRVLVFSRFVLGSTRRNSSQEYAKPLHRRTTLWQSVRDVRSRQLGLQKRAIQRAATGTAFVERRLLGGRNELVIVTNVLLYPRAYVQLVIVNAFVAVYV